MPSDESNPKMVYLFARSNFYFYSSSNYFLKTKNIKCHIEDPTLPTFQWMRRSVSAIVKKTKWGSPTFVVEGLNSLL